LITTPHRNDRRRAMLRIAIIIGSPARNCEAVAKWAYEIARRRDDFSVFKPATAQEQYAHRA